MANTPEIKKTNVGIATQNIYVVPSATTTVVIGITLAMYLEQEQSLVLELRPSADDVKVLKNVAVPQGLP